jgi:protein-tyrosine phosphatase
MIDLHCHLLPGVDDGAEHMNAALSLARAALADGIQVAVMTPHLHPGRYDNTRQGLQVVLEQFRQRLAEASLPLEIRLGGEVRLSAEIFDMIAEDSVPFLGTVDGYRIMLLEFPHQMIPVGADKLITTLLRRRIRPLIAHPERNKAIMEKPQRLRPLVDLGCWLQLTAGSLAGRFGANAEQTAWQILESGANCIVATDAHNLQHRPPCLSEGRDALIRRYGEARALDLVQHKPARILGMEMPLAKAA